MNLTSAKRWLLIGAAGWLAVGGVLPVDAQVDAQRGGRKPVADAPKVDAPQLAAPLVAGQVADGPNGRLLQRVGTNQLRHGSRILSLAYSPNGQILVAGGGADPIRVWDTNTGQQKLACPETWVNAIVFTSRGSVFITGGAFKTIRLWETATGKESGKLIGHTAPVKALALSADGSMLASAGQDGTIILWELSTSKKIIELKDHTDEVTALAFCAAIDIPVFVSGSNDRTVRIWDADTNQLKKKIDAGCGVLAVAITPDGKTVFSAGDDNLIRAWDADTGKLGETLKGHDGMVLSLAVSRDGKMLISGGRDKTIRVWDLANLQAKPRIIPRHLGDSDALAVSKDAKHVAAAGLNNTIRIFETASGKEQFAGSDPQAGLGGLTISRDGRMLAAVTAPGVVYVWDAVTGKLEREWASGQTGDIVLAFSPDSKSLVTAADTVRFWDPHTGKAQSEVPAPGTKWAVASIAFGPDGAVAIGDRNGTVVLRSTEAHKPVPIMKYPGQPYALAFSTDGKLLAIAGGSKIVIWDCAANKELRRFECKEAPPKSILPDVAALAFSSDRKTLAAACFDGVIRIMDYTTGKEVGMCEGHQAVPYAIAYAPDGRTLLSGSFDATVRLWEPYSGAQLAELKGHAGPVYGVALSPDARIAYSAGADTCVLIWDATGFGKGGPPKAALNGNEFEQAWKDLASDNAPATRQVVWRLIGNPQGVAADLKTRVHLVDVARVNKLVADLDSDDYDSREAATKELEKQGRWLEGRLKEALEKPPSLEYKRRIEQLLEKLQDKAALTLRQEQLRLRRAMMVLEYIGDDASIDLLGRLSKQAPEEMFRQEAQTTLRRMGKTPAAKTAGP
jgi:WD40 repeat protein